MWNPLTEQHGKLVRIRSYWARLYLLMVCVIGTASAPGYAQSVLSGFGTPNIDGKLSTGEWEEAASVNFDVRTPMSAGGHLVPGKVLVMNDLSNLYLAVTFETVEEGNSASFEFDETLEGQIAPGNDILLINPSPQVGFTDSHRSAEYYGIYDISGGGTIDGEGAFSNDGGVTIYEFSHPLDSGDYEHDFSLRPGMQVAFRMSVRLIDSETDQGWPYNGADTDLFPLGESDGWGRIRIIGGPSQSKVDHTYFLRAKAAINRRSETP